jgi:DNA polymerase-3 subunit beta
VLLSNEVTTNILIPKESLGDVLKLTKKSPGEEIILVCDQNLLTFKSELRVLTCRRLHGSFPNYVMMFPQGATVKADCNASLLRRSLTRASNLASEETRGIILTFRPEEIEIQTQGDYGDINETIYANYDGEPMAIGFNSKYLLDFLREGVEDEHDRILFNITSPLKPIELGSQALEGYRYVVTPRNIPGANQSVAEKEVTAVQG